jgi:hypothetical protein
VETFLNTVVPEREDKERKKNGDRVGFIEANIPY